MDSKLVSKLANKVPTLAHKLDLTKLEVSLRSLNPYFLECQRQLIQKLFDFPRNYSSHPLHRSKWWNGKGWLCENNLRRRI